MGNENLSRLLLKHNADVNIQDNGGCTPLHLSAHNSSYSEIIDLLVKYGVQNINIRDSEGLTPLQMSVRHGNAQAVKRLVDLGADVSVFKADKTGARRLKLLKKEAERMEEHLKLGFGYAQKANETKHTTRVASVQGAENITESHLKPPVERLLDLGSDVSVFKADKTDARRLKLLKKEAERMEEHLELGFGYAQKANETKYTTRVASVPGAENLTQSHLKSEKVLRQTSSYTYTTMEIEEGEEVEQVRTLAVRHPKSKATTSSRTNKCVMA